MKIDSLISPGTPATIAARAREFENLGFDCVWSFEATSDPFLPLAHAAAATERLEIGTNIAVAFARSTFSMAQIAWDLQRDSRGRFRLGLGTQVRPHVERRFSMSFDQPAARVIDYIRCVRAIWDTFQNGTKPAYEGDYYQFKLMNPFFQPGPIDQPDIPIYLAGVNPRMCRAAGQVADGFHVHPLHSAGYLRDVVRPALDEGSKIEGRAINELELYAPVFIVAGESQEETDAMEQVVRQQIAFYGSTPSYAAVLDYHGLGDLPQRLNKLMREGNATAMGSAIPESFLEAVAIIAKPNEIGARIRERYNGLLDRVSLYASMGGEGGFKRWTELVGAVHADEGR